MNKLRKQSDTTYPIFFFMVDSTDHITGKTGLSPTVTISKNGGSFASPSGAVTEVGNGLYKIAGNATDSNTVGELWIHATGTAADPTDTSYTIVPFNPFDSVRLGLTALPNVAAAGNGGLPTVNASNQVKANVEAIDGSATNGNNAVLKLKSLDLRSNDTSIAALDVRGATGGFGLNGGKAANFLGGGAGTGGATGGDGIYSAGGGALSYRGYGLNLDSPYSGQGGLRVSGNMTTAAALFQGDSFTDGIRATGGYEWVGGINANIKGSVGNVSTSRPVKNVGYDNFMFPMFDSSTKSPKTGLSVMAERAIDGNPFSPCSNAVAELGSGVYRISLSASDMNGDKIMFRFTATGADDQLIEVFTQG